jgi:hypothetical protein
LPFPRLISRLDVGPYLVARLCGAPNVVFNDQREPYRLPEPRGLVLEFGDALLGHLELARTR